MVITVAVRELEDALYRAFRTSGVEAGQARARARATGYAVGHLGAEVSRTTRLLEAGDLPPFGLIHVLQAESSRAPVDVEPATAIADVAFFAIQALRRGTVIAMTEASSVAAAPSIWVSGNAERQVKQLMVVSPDSTEATSDVLEDMSAQRHELLRTGIDVAESDWSHLQSLASRYLVSERTIDEAEQQSN